MMMWTCKWEPVFWRNITAFIFRAETVFSFEVFDTNLQVYDPEDQFGQLLCCENIKSQKRKYLILACLLVQEGMYGVSRGTSSRAWVISVCLKKGLKVS